MNECRPLVEIYFHEFVHEVVFLRWLYSKDLYEESLGKQNYVFPRDHSLSRISSTKNDRVT